MKIKIALAIMFAGITTTASAAVFDFESVPHSTLTTFADSQDGISAIFSSPSLPGAFIVGRVYVTQFGGNALSTPSNISFGVVQIPLEISFGTLLRSIRLDFATTELAPFTLAAFNGASSVGNLTETGQIIKCCFPEGRISFSAANFDQIVLKSSADYFGIDNIHISAVPP